MRKAGRLSAFVLLFAASLLGRPALAEPVQTPVADIVDTAEVRREGDSFRHLAANFLFPASLGDLPARQLTTFGPRDMSVTYTLAGGANGDAWINLFVYPADGSPEEEAFGVEQDLFERYTAKTMAEPLNVAAPDKNILSGWYIITMNEKRYVSSFQLAHYGDWAVKVRFSMPIDASPEVRARAAGALAAQPARWR